MKKTLFIAASLLLASSPTFAAKMTMPADAPASYEAECASCHMAYPPALLSEQSWKNVMSSLSKHFGTDASVDAKTQAELTNWLIKNAATRQKYSETAPENRITKTSWFIRKHDEVRPDVWKRAGIKSPANCSACHIDAANGIFSEKNIKIPAK
ncbi:MULTISPECIES: diheme cytochrome c [unclassified Polynucleobacter]|uniref:diheme cytochrome c n=1 Tax=unclassified Polynucleobacter TaxID=2640945 RepID=UPI002106CFC9|nr:MULTISPECIES: diheme cytochrome c [unclassified Polynucleobacter]